MIIFLIWLIGTAIFLYPVYSAMLKALTDTRPNDTEDRILSIIMAVLIVGFWPAVLIGLGMFLISHRIWRGYWIPKWMKPTPQDAVQ